KSFNSSSETEPIVEAYYNLQPTPKLLKLSNVTDAPAGEGSVVDQANGKARQADVVNPDGSGVVPLLEPMVCVTNRIPMDFTIEEANKYMRTE
nr:hypothetical protein [Tanacetum cinerariifolium]